MPTFFSRFLLFIGLVATGWNSFLVAQSRGDLIDVTVVDSLDIDDIRGIYASVGLSEFLVPIEYDVNVVKVSYYTRAVQEDTLIAASGLLLVPQGDCDFPLVGYGHGTTFYGSIPSLQTNGEWLIGAAFAANGYMLAMPDYLGYGATPLDHPHAFVHARSEAWSIVDMLRASRHLAEQDSIRLNDQVFLVGYSQGGHAAMAAHREIEEFHADEFELTAVAPCSGPYDISGVQFADITAEKPTNSFYLAFVMTSYQFVYGNIWQNPSDAFVSPWDTLIPQYFDRQNPMPVPLPDTAIRMLQPAYLQAILSDSMHPARVALRDNDLTSWTPQAPMRMYYCEADEVVPYQNALVAQDSFVARGATTTAALSAGAGFGHGECAGTALIFSKLWFDGFRAACTIEQDTVPQDSIPTNLQALLAQQIRVGPNPNQGRLYFYEQGTGLTEPLHIQLFTLSGALVAEQFISPGFGQASWDLPALADGLYALRMRNRKASSQQLLQIRR